MDKLLLAVLILVSAALFIYPLWQRLRIVKMGKGGLETAPVRPRVGRFVSEVLFQSKVIRERPFPGFMHALVFWGFVAFALETLDHFLEGFGATVLGHGAFQAGFAKVVSVFAVLVLVGIIALAIRRAFFRPKSLGDKLSWESLLVALFIVILMVTYLVPEMGMMEEGTRADQINWWLHALVILAFLPLIVRSKHLHLILSPVTTFTKDFRLAAIKPLDFEKEEFGAETFTDLQEHSLLGAFSCVECGRCQDQCPAFNTGKLLNPKYIMLDMKRGLLADPTVQAVGDDLIKEEVIFQCTTCGACTYQCPVGIDQVVPIIDLRRGQVANGSFPDTFTTAFKNLETAGNPWAYQPESGTEFIQENDFPIYDADQHDTLYWMGCLGRYDDKYRKVSKAFSQVLNSAGVKWGVLADERCTGDSARRAGNEFLFTMLAEHNIELLNAAKPKRIVGTCPHCVWTIEEYRDFGLSPDIEITHHAEFMDELVKAGQLAPTATNGNAMAYHDPCYLSRYRAPEGVTKPRDVLAATGTQVIEPERTKDRSFCCGAGGAMVFREENEGTRINHDRVDELIATGAKSVAVACPFCRLMVGDGMADRGKEEIEVKDLAQVMAERLK